MKKFYKNTFNFEWIPNPNKRREEIVNNIIDNADFLPKPLLYEDIDRAMKEWVESKIVVLQDGIKLPTMVLYSNQRFSEYLQSWSFTDENNNVRLNFKTITRDNNPLHGTILGDTYNIPGNRFYTLKSIPAIDESGKKYRIDYKMRQPTPVDLTYKISIMTNRYTSINEFNEVVNHLFNAKQEYISPNGHYMSITLESVNDESEYNIEDRQFFSQTFVTNVKGYIIREEDILVEENPIASIICFDGDTGKRNKPSIELFEYEPSLNQDGVLVKEIEIDVDLTFYPFNGKTKFTIDENMFLTNFILKPQSNINEDKIKLYINGELKTDNLLNFIQDESYNSNKLLFLDGDEIVIETKRINKNKKTNGFTILGYTVLENL